jgi:hypothetical protein
VAAALVVALSLFAKDIRTATDSSCPAAPIRSFAGYKSTKPGKDFNHGFQD